VGQELSLSGAAVNSRVPKVREKPRLSSIEALCTPATALPVALEAAGASSAIALRLCHQSRWLPDVALNIAAPFGARCRRVCNSRTLRDVADYLHECGGQPGSAPDDPVAVVMLRTGTIGAKQALLAALAAECGRDDVRLIVACHELELHSNVEIAGRRLTLPLAVCYLHCRSRIVQIAASCARSIGLSKAIAAVRVDPLRLASERVRLYQTFATDWCRALDMNPAVFARLRAEQLRRAEGCSLFEDLLGHQIPPDFAPIV
jgi:hypothetical protein